jgi:hypothetical protein
VRGERVEAFRRRVCSSFGWFGGSVRYARVVTDVHACGYARVVPDASGFAGTPAFRCRQAFGRRHGFREPEEFPARDNFPAPDEFSDEHEFRDA